VIEGTSARSVERYDLIGVEVVCFDNAGAVTGAVGASTDDDDAEATETAAAA